MTHGSSLPWLTQSFDSTLDEIDFLADYERENDWLREHTLRDF